MRLGLESRLWDIGICVNVNRVCGSFVELYGSIAITKNVKEMRSFQGGID